MQQRYPENLQVDIEDFRRSEWKAAMESPGRKDYSRMKDSLATAAQTALEQGKLAEGKVLWLLADACSMILKPQSLNEPFKPWIVMGGKRSVVPEDFEQSIITLFCQIAEEVNDAWLQARLADLVWLLKRPRSPQHARLAIDAYRTIPLEKETWRRGGQACWERALSLTRMLGGGAGTRMQEIEAAILSAFGTATADDEFLARDLANLLAIHGLGRAQGVDIARKLEALAWGCDTKGAFYTAQEFFTVAAQWFKQAGDAAKATAMTVCVAESWVKEADARRASAQPSHMVAASFYEKAMQIYRSIPRRERATHHLDERIAELHRRLQEAGERSLDEMGIISSPVSDMTSLREWAREMVRNKTALDALMAFANIYPGARVAQIRESAEQTLRDHPLLAHVSATRMSRDGRVIAKRPGLDLHDINTPESQATMWAQMIKDYEIELAIVVQGSIWPALEVLLLEHRLCEHDFVALAANSPCVPLGRAGLFGKALFAGYDQDFVVALHLLVPQIEHMVRWHLKATGIKTTTLDSNGIENENGLSTLMDLPKAQQVFGEDLAFEIKALFCDPFGPNLRNELAHGLLDEEACQSTYALYAWWFGLRLVLHAFWYAKRQAEVDTDAQHDA